ncbi:MAG: TIGR01906 family membrane protein [Solobacterium sp.]|nr:TIGR01906 family membrane protein [Solobacterium sp.]
MKASKLCSILACFLASVAILATVIDVCCFNQGFYRREYEKNDTSSYTGMNAEDNLNATMALLDYLRETRNDIVVTAEVNGVTREVFNERETLHMVDVRDLYQRAVTVRNLCAIVAVILLFGAMYYGRKSLFTVLHDGWITGVGMVVLLIVFIAIWALADFNAFWTNFHLLFFDNDLWLLDPRTSIMINLFPGSFFFDLVLRIIVITLVIFGGISLLSLKGRNA